MVGEGGICIQFSNLIYLLSYLLRSSMQNLVLKKLHHKTRPGGKYVLNPVKILLPTTWSYVFTYIFQLELNEKSKSENVTHFFHMISGP